MRLLACILLVITTSYAASIEESTGICEPGKGFKYYCNTCYCAGNGKIADSTCTEMYCEPGRWTMDGVFLDNENRRHSLLRIASAEVKETCEPGYQFMNYCNTCVCGNDGLLNNAACTRMYCSSDNWHKNGTRKAPTVRESSFQETLEDINQGRCEPGKGFMNYCNRCRCGNEGLVTRSVCTYMYCSPDIWNRDGSLKPYSKTSDIPRVARNKRQVHDEICVPGSWFMRGCNTCLCGVHGRGMCSIFPCDPANPSNRLDGVTPVIPGNVVVPAVPVIPVNPGKPVNPSIPDSNKDVSPKAQGKRCEPGRSFKDYCNTCSCTPTGLPFCTRMFCHPDIWNQDGSLKYHYAIAVHPLVRQVRDVEERCEPGKRFMNYCNTCICGDNGTPRCTRMYCDPAKWNKDGSLKHFDEELAIELFDGLSRRVETTCEPGKRFMDQCNTCSCAIDGSFAICTKMFCDSSVPENSEIPRPSSENLPSTRIQDSNEFLCQPGRSFKSDCNQCVCSSDGRNAACTQMFCPSRQTYAAPEVCEPRKLFNIDCNQCACNKDGTKIVCTLIDCPPASE